jgi:uncharacterized protein YigE (DUF2233 family)
MEPMDRDSVFGAFAVIGLLTLVFGWRHGRAEEDPTAEGPPVRIAPSDAVDSPSAPADGDGLAPVQNPLLDGDAVSAWQVVAIDTRTTQLDLLGQGESVHVRTLGAASAWAEAQGRVLVMATNAGIFEPDMSPTGLFVAQGATLAPLNRRPGRGNFFLEPNGVFAVDVAGRARVLSTDKHAGQPIEGGAVLATQSGPLVLDEGAIHPLFQAGSSNLRVRSGVGVSRTDPHQVFFAISKAPVRFHDMATFFRDELGCDQALYLDGVISGMGGPEVPRSVGAPGPFAGVLVATTAP